MRTGPPVCTVFTDDGDNKDDNDDDDDADMFTREVVRQVRLLDAIYS